MDAEKFHLDIEEEIKTDIAGCGSVNFKPVNTYSKGYVTKSEWINSEIEVLEISGTVSKN